MKTIHYLSALAGLVLLYSCGTTATVSETVEVTLPSMEEANSVISSLVPVQAARQVIPYTTESGPKIFCLYPQDGSNDMNVLTLAPVEGRWEKENLLSYPCFEADGTAFKKFTEDIKVERIAENDFFLLKALREDGKGKAQRSVITFDPNKENLEAVSFCGSYLGDGRIEGSSYVDVVAGALNPAVEFARDLLMSDASLVELSKADEMTDQAIQWWLKNNPNAQSSARSITYGALDNESSLVASYRKTKKESSNNYNAALFNIRGYTVIVVQRKSNGTSVLAWAEPVCTNKNTDQLLNNIYFRDASNLTLFYYKGKRTFNYQLNLATGRLMK